MTDFASKKYRNVFLEIGKSQEEIDKKIDKAFETFFYDKEERIYHEAAPDMGYLEDTGNHDARTEGMSYGMMMCVQLDKNCVHILSDNPKYKEMTEGDESQDFRVIGKVRYVMHKVQG